MDRRAFLFLAGSTAVLAWPEMASALAASRYEDIRYVITDSRHAQSLEFGRRLSSTGSTRLEITDGVTKLWQESLAPLWRGRGGAVAGLTTREAWHCLAEQARSQAHRTVVLRQHDGETGHRYPLVSWLIA